MSVALIDGDIVAYRCAASAEHEGEEIALLRVEGMMQEILSKHEEYKAFLSGPNNFRYKIYPEYKANRVNKDKPLYLKDCQDYLVNEYKAVVCDGYEADDALGFSQTEDSVIYSIDKDLLMIPGWHFNFVKGELKEVSELDGLRQFYRQMLIGDTADNVKGVDGIGKVKAGRLIDHLEDEREMYDIVARLYCDPKNSGDGSTMDRFYMNADCLWIWRHEGEVYTKRMVRGTEEILYNIGLARGIEKMAGKVQVFGPSLCEDGYQQEEWEIGETLPLQPL